MKKIIIFLGVIATHITHAQMQKGSILLGPSFNYSQNGYSNKYESNSNNGNEYKYRSLSSQLRVGFFYRIG